MKEQMEGELPNDLGLMEGKLDSNVYRIVKIDH